MIGLDLISAVLFILGFRNFAALRTARIGNMLAIAGTAVCVLSTLVEYFNIPDFTIKFVWLIGAAGVGGAIGIGVTNSLKMHHLPQLVAAFHSLVGLAAVIADSSLFYFPNNFGVNDVFGLLALEIALGTAVGAVTFAGSIIAFLKLQGTIKGIVLKQNLLRYMNIILYWALMIAIFGFLIQPGELLCWLILGFSFLFGASFTCSIKGADMPVIVSLLNAFSGLAALSIGFTFRISLLVVIGALVAASGAFLSWSMCKGMNRSLAGVLLAGIKSGKVDGGGKSEEGQQAKTIDLTDAAYFLENAESVVIVPGYGMAVSQAQHALKTLLDKLLAKGIKVRFAVHPVAGRMPGHMNVLLAEANILDDFVVELEEINAEFPSVDVVLVVGANDIVNPSAEDDKSSPIFGMPVLRVWAARTVIAIKRSMNPGYSGIGNPLFFKDNTFMLLGDAKKLLEKLGL